MHRRWCTAGDAPQVMHRRWCTACDALQVMHCIWCTAGDAPQVMHCRWCTEGDAPHCTSRKWGRYKCRYKTQGLIWGKFLLTRWSSRRFAHITHWVLFDKKLALKRNFLEGNLYFRRRKSHSCWTGGSKRPEGGLHFLAPLLGGAPFPNVKFFRQILMLWSSLIWVIKVACSSWRPHTNLGSSSPQWD